MKNQKEKLAEFKQNSNSVTVTKKDSDGNVISSQTKTEKNASEFILNDAIKTVLSKIPESAAKNNNLTGRDKIYVYPENCVSIVDQKKFRVNCRKFTDMHLYNILHAAKSGSNLNEAITNFLEYYKLKFRTQNFEIASISHTQKKQQIEHYTVALNIVKQFVSSSK